MPDETGAGATVVFGTDGQDSIGIVQSEHVKNSVEVAEARDASGKVIALKAYSKSSERTIEALFTSGTTLPEIGQTISISGWTGIVTASSIAKTNKQFATFSITAVSKDSAAVSVYS